MKLSVLLLALSVHFFASVVTPNPDIVTGIPHSKVVHLTEANFEAMITDPANGLWFLKFYAPWCGHCQKLAPVLDDIAEYLKGKMAIGKIDCTVERRLCSKFDIDGYPVLKIYRDGEYFDYPGKRDHDSIIIFGEKMSSYSVHVAHSYPEILESFVPKSDTGVVFVAYDAQATENPSADKSTPVEQLIQSTTPLQVFGQVARMMQAYADFVLLHPSTPQTELARFGISSESNNQVLFVAQVQVDASPFLYPNMDTFTTASLFDFVKTYNIPLVTHLDADNFRSVGRKGKPLAIAVVNPDHKEISDQFISKWKEYARTGPKSITDSYIFSSIDGKKWSGFLQQFSMDTSTLPQILILDVPKRRYWYNASMPMEEFMPAVTKGEVPYRIQTNSQNGWMARIEEFMWLYAPYSFFLAVLILAGIIYLLTMSCFEEKEIVVVDPRIKKDN